jgi:hypothetical protein
MVTIDVDSGLNALAANFFAAPQRGTTDYRRGDSPFTVVENILPIFSFFVFEASFLSARFS